MDRPPARAAAWPLGPPWVLASSIQPAREACMRSLYNDRHDGAMSGDAIAFCAANRYPRGRIIRTAGTCMDSGRPGLIDRLRGALRRLRGAARRVRQDRAFLFKAT